jgi:hypothetical protein
MSSGYTCKTCNEFHPGLPIAYGAEAPAYWASVPPDERQRRGELSSDQCVIDENFFVLGRLEIPIVGEPEIFSWNVWVSLSETNFMRVQELWKMRGREREPPYFGWLNTSLPCYPETLNLKVQLHTRAIGLRPFVELEATDHPLSIEQRTGITMLRVQEIAECVLHSQ